MNPLHRTIPLFDDTVQADPANARQDRLKVRWGDWYRNGTDVDLQRYIDGIPRTYVTDGDGVEFILTGSPTGSRRDQFQILSGRAGIVDGRDYALFAGHFHIYYVQRPQQNRPGRLRVFADLSLNPTRYAAYQDRPSRQRHSPELQLPERIMRRPSPTRRSGTDHESSSSERMLVPEHDNAIVADSFFLRNYDAPVWRRHVHNYLQGVYELLWQTVGDHRQVSEVPEINLQEAETYFEFTHPSPVAAIAELQEAIVARRAHVGITVYPSGTFENSVSGNARCITIRRSRAITLKVYAKTTKRIRIEVVHDLTEDASSIGGSHTTRNVETFQSWFDLLAVDAARHVNELLLDFRPGLPSGVQPASTPADIIRLVAGACERTQDVPSMLELLCINRRLAIDINDPLASVKDRLVRDGLLIPRPRNTRDTVYTVAPQYDNALTRLRTLLFGA